jgi:hypothetical protein
MFSRKIMFKRAEQMEVAWSKIGTIRRMLEDFPLEISLRLICLGVPILYKGKSPPGSDSSPKNFMLLAFRGL